MRLGGCPGETDLKGGCVGIEEVFGQRLVAQGLQEQLRKEPVSGTASGMPGNWLRKDSKSSCARNVSVRTGSMRLLRASNCMKA